MTIIINGLNQAEAMTILSLIRHSLRDLTLGNTLIGTLMMIIVRAALDKQRRKNLLIRLSLILLINRGTNRISNSIKILQINTSTRRLMNRKDKLTIITSAQTSYRILMRIQDILLGTIDKMNKTNRKSRITTLRRVNNLTPEKIRNLQQSTTLLMRLGRTTSLLSANLVVRNMLTIIVVRRKLSTYNRRVFNIMARHNTRMSVLTILRSNITNNRMFVPYNQGLIQVGTTLLRRLNIPMNQTVISVP